MAADPRCASAPATAPSTSGAVKRGFLRARLLLSSLVGGSMPGFDPRQLQEMVSVAKRQYEELQRKLQQTTVEATSGGGSVSVKMNGQKQVLGIKIDPEVAKAGDLEMLQDLVMAAVNAAGHKVDEAMQSSLGGMLGGMGLV